MHFIPIIALVILALFFPSPGRAGGGGPDAFGYTWADSDSSAVVFRWVDIVGRQGANQITSLRDDNQSSLIPLGFPFHYYWTTHTFLSIGSNGWASLGNGVVGNAHCFQSMPSTNAQASNNTLAPFLGDLNFNSSYPTLPNIGQCWYWTSPSLDSFVVTFLQVPFWKNDNFATDPPDWIGANTFQIILEARDSSITFQYLHIDRDSVQLYANCMTDNIIGIENSTGQIGLTVRQEDLPPDSFAIHFSFPKEDTFKVRDAAAQWNLNPLSKARFLLPGHPLTMETLVRNAGNVALDSLTHIESKILSSGFNLRWVGRDSVPSLALGGDTLISYPNQANLTLPGQYYFNTALDNPEDFNLNNDLISAELDVVDTNLAITTLQYNLGTSTETSTSWPPGISGDYGAGVYMRPPWDYYRVASIELFIVGNDGDPNTPLPAGFRVDLYEEDSLGNPGLLRYSSVVTPATAVEDGWNTLVLPIPPEFDLKGFFVGWVQGGPGIGLGNEVAGPKSRQTYEIISSVWAPYRAQNTEDFLVRVQIEPLAVGVGEGAAPRLAVQAFPNPCQGNLSLAWEHTGGWVNVTLRDFAGREIWSAKSPNLPPNRQVRELSFGNAANGVYFLEVSTKAGNVSRLISLVR